MAEALDEYIRRINQYSLIDVEEEARLAREIARGNAWAREKLIVSNLRLVVKIAHEFTGRGVLLEDLISEGNIGLIKAAEKYQAGRGAKFSSYSSWWIKQYIKKAIKNKRIVRIPQNTSDKMVHVYRARNRLIEILGRSPTNKELVKETGYTEKIVKTAMDARRELIDLEQDGRSHQEGLENIPEEVCEKPRYAEMQKYACELLNELDYKKKRILEMCFGLNGEITPISLGELGRMMGRTRERARQIKEEALGEIRRKLVRSGIYKELGY